MIWKCPLFVCAVTVLLVNFRNCVLSCLPPAHHHPSSPTRSHAGIGEQLCSAAGMLSTPWLHSDWLASSSDEDVHDEAVRIERRCPTRPGPPSLSQDLAMRSTSANLRCGAVKRGRPSAIDLLLRDCRQEALGPPQPKRSRAECLRIARDARKAKRLAAQPSSDAGVAHKRVAARLSSHVGMSAENLSAFHVFLRTGSSCSTAAAKSNHGASISCMQTLPGVCAVELLDAEEAAFRVLLQDIAEDVSSGRARGIAYHDWMGYDETPERADVIVVTPPESAGGPSQEGRVKRTGGRIAKIMAGRRRFSMLLAYLEPAGAGPATSGHIAPVGAAGPAPTRARAAEQFHVISGCRGTMLTPMSHQKTNVVLTVLQRLRHHSAEVGDLLRRIFPYRSVVSLADSHRSNIAAERVDAHEHAGWTHVALRCRIHRLDTCEKRVVDLCRSTISGMVNLGLYLTGFQRDEVMDKMRDIIRKELKIYVASPASTRARDRRAELQQVFMSSSCRRAAEQRRVVWDELWNGDITNESEIQHVCRGCCRDRDHAVEKMTGVGLDLLWSGRRQWSRKSWDGHDLAIDDVAVLQATHGLLSRAMAPDATSADARAPKPPTDAAPTWADQAELLRRSARQFVLQDGFLDTLAVLRVVIGPITAMKNEVLAQAGSAWHIQRYANAALSNMTQKKPSSDAGVLGGSPGQPDLAAGVPSDSQGGPGPSLSSDVGFHNTGAAGPRLTSGFEPESQTSKCLQSIMQLFTVSKPWAVVSERYWQKEENVVRVFKQIARLGAAVLQLVRVIELGFPHRLGAVAASGDRRLAEEVVSACHRQVDAVTLDLIKRYSTADALLSTEAIEEISLLNLTVDGGLDSVLVERDHARVRRRARARTQTHAPTVDDLSADRAVAHERVGITTAWYATPSIRCPPPSSLPAARGKKRAAPPGLAVASKATSC